MPEIIACPECQQQLRVQDDLLGQPVKCPACRTTFTATGPASAPPPASVPREPERSPRDRDRREEAREDERDRRPRDDYEDEEDDYDERRRPSRADLREAASSKVAAGICGILLGALGVHKFIIGLTTPGIIMLLVSLLGGVVTCGVATLVMSIIGLIEGIIYLTKTDEEFYRLYYVEKKEWF
jgi:predicted Zn finger-like uncharacterized protein